MAVSAPPLIATTAVVARGARQACSGRTAVLSPAESPRLTNSLVNSTLSGGGGNERKTVHLHGVKGASLLLKGQELICSPQVFYLFLKPLVGGLHTVYTKLKRLDIPAVVRTVE